MPRFNIDSVEPIAQIGGFNVPPNLWIRALGPIQLYPQRPGPIPYGFHVFVENVGGAQLDGIDVRQLRNPGGPYTTNPQTVNIGPGIAVDVGGQFANQFIEVWVLTATPTQINVYLETVVMSVEGQG